MPIKTYKKHQVTNVRNSLTADNNTTLRKRSFELITQMSSNSLLIVAFAGLGTSGTQTLIYGFVANYYRTNVRGAAVAWCAGFGRLGGVGGPLLGGFLLGAGLALDSIFYVLAGLCLLGLAVTLLVPVARGRDTTVITIEPATPGGSADAASRP